MALSSYGETIVPIDSTKIDSNQSISKIEKSEKKLSRREQRKIRREQEENDSTIVRYRPSFKKVIAWPFEKVIGPTFNFILFPFIEPINYLTQKEVIDHGKKFVLHGPRENFIFLPIIVPLVGSNNMVGFTIYYKNIIEGVKNEFYFNSEFYINQDKYLRAYYEHKDLFFKDFKVLFYAGKWFNSDNSFYPIDSDISYNFTDSTLRTYADFNYKFTKDFSFNFRTGYRNFIHGKPLKVKDTLLSYTDTLGYDAGNRGVYQSYRAVPLRFSFRFNTTDKSQIPTKGWFMECEYAHWFIGDYYGSQTDSAMAAGMDFNSASHDFNFTSFTARKHILLGHKSYKMSKKEAKKLKKFYKDISLFSVANKFKSENIMETLFEKKVLLFQYRTAFIWETDYGMTPFTSFKFTGLGDKSNLRGYPTRRFNDYAIHSFDMEYRWPINKFLDGTFFNEYALYGEKLYSTPWSSLKNSWGFGVRLRTNSSFLWRGQVGFHGFNGAHIILTTTGAF